MPRITTIDQLAKIQGLSEALKAVDYLLATPGKELPGLENKRKNLKNQKTLIITDLLTAVEDFTDIR